MEFSFTSATGDGAAILPDVSRVAGLRYRTLAAGRALALRNTQPRHLATRFLVRVNDAVWHKNQYASGGALPGFPGDNLYLLWHRQ